MAMNIAGKSTGNTNSDMTNKTSQKRGSTVKKERRHKAVQWSGTQAKCPALQQAVQQQELDRTADLELLVFLYPLLPAPGQFLHHGRQLLLVHTEGVKANPSLAVFTTL